MTDELPPLRAAFNRWCEDYALEDEPNYSIETLQDCWAAWQAADAAAVARERDWWREIAQQLIDCHDEPTCPAVTLAKERLDDR